MRAFEGSRRQVRRLWNLNGVLESGESVQLRVWCGQRHAQDRKPGEEATETESETVMESVFPTGRHTSAERR